MSFGERLQHAREISGLTLDEVARKVGKSKSTVQRYESGQVSKLDNEIIGNLADAVNVSPIYLMGWTNVAELPITVTRIPLLGTITMGEPITAEQNVGEYKQRISEDLPKGDLFYLECKGDSMFPLIQNGALALCRVQDDVENGEIAAVLVNGDTEATLKRVKKIGSEILLQPENNDYEPIIINKNNPARIIGKVVEVSFKL